ncbi:MULTISPECIES: sensor histidine kinase [unclassified Cryobacterium]|uniref:sensor histidine kinase n=1 Tax=unclassified Cryobacterium TaxID=2649013 RepID=UPI00106D4C85|nr:MULTISPECIES: histidine kinase [unclassified Cryobacterium]TFB96876.1 hypothetical protein E3O39_09115 [Cryobacterium sp. MDB2-A-1]TFC07220.1 hypothetical protein E3O59_09720 [Cryobacterium sp. MDB2-33-2]TFC12197.1 hypothetical protein E3O35_09360 [Cryobacterium sp. MDB2-A-2]TFC16273.1 hypothetical protein E3O51_12625 [Cryobacterium sp. MDB2-10]TFC34544.1 hypothetical protein E3O55_02740 [Cryobacterium sp. MDB1-18-2]
MLLFRHQLRRLYPGAVARLRRPRALAWSVLAIITIALFSTAVPVTIDVYDTPIALTFLTFTILCGSILLAPRFPKIGSMLNLGALAGLIVLTAHSPGQYWPLPITGLLAFCALIAVLGIWGGWLLPLAVWWLGIVLILLVAAIMSRPTGGLTNWQSSIIGDSSISALVLALSIAIGQRQRIRDQLASAKRDVELEHARREHAEERGRIAREMHDVVVHSMSLVHIQASSAPYRIPDLDDETRAEFENIARSARSALNEMRQVLGVLRPDARDLPFSPQPQLSDLKELALVTTRAGSPVTLSIGSNATTLSSVVQLAAYRTVQEALGNALRHAPGAAVSVQFQIVKDKLQVEITNDPAEPDPTMHRPAEALGTGGRGLQGIQERTAQLRGQTEHGPTPEGGFRVFAAFPVCAETTKNGDL